ncbi:MULTISPECIES: hypothetical protein [Arthrobacter]|uniref:ABC-2 type transport system permease protein n=2 Tax=Arthrobacter TaxID=1663 RepID=A0ABU9KLQ3_9MICC|nr:hypothetical protein [Arthrobacter sp. YJM1]MDP5228457.1 hypothetical protein [Arthrobacter sp. YJM1]
MTLAEVRALFRGSGPQERWYPWYLAALVVGLVLAPGYWSLATVLAPVMSPAGAGTATVVSAGIAVVLVLAAAFSPAYLGPVWTSAEEIHYLVGPFGIRPVLGVRTRLLQVLTGVVCLGLVMLPVLAWWQGAGRPAGGAEPFLAGAGLGLAGAVGAAMAAGGKQSRRPVEGGPRGLDVPRLEELTTARDTALAGVLIGDGRALAGAVPRRRARRPGSTMPRGLLARSWAIDLRYAQQDPWRIAGSLLLVVLASLAMGRWGSDAGTLAAVLLTTQLAMTRVSGALGDVADTLGYDVVVPQSAAARLLAHLLFPVAAVVPLAVIPALILGPATAGGALGMVVCAVLLRMATLGVAGLPAQLLTPVSTPMGDTTAMFMVLWLLRPVIPVAWVLWAGLSFPLERVTGVLLACLAVLALLRLFALSRRV